MTRVLRQLSAIYLLMTAAFFAVALHAQYPTLTRSPGGAAKAIAASFDAHVVKPVLIYAQTQSAHLFGHTKVWTGHEARALRTASVERHSTAAHHHRKIFDEPVTIVRLDLPAFDDVASPPARKVAKAKPAAPALTADKPVELAQSEPKVEFALPPEQDFGPGHPAPSKAELVQVAERLKSSLSDELLSNFDLFLYVSKAGSGSWSQRMYVFAKQTDGDLSLLYNWPVSTGREKWETDANGHKQNSFTPEGYYELDPQRMHARYMSSQWHQPMPYAMFFDWEQAGYKTGLAIHGASGEDVSQLGERASAGCVRLAPENAKLLFNLIRTRYKGIAPKFAFDRRTETMSNSGVLQHDKDGNLIYADGYKALVFIENYGGSNVVAALF